MFNRKKIKLYIHHGRFVPLKFGARNAAGKIFARSANFTFEIFYSLGLWVISLLAFFGRLIMRALFRTGEALISLWQKSAKGARKDFLKTREILPKRYKLALQSNFGRTFLLFLLAASLGWGGIASLKLIAKGLEVKNQILKTASLGQGYLNQAKDALAKQDFAGAENRFSLAYRTFSQGRQNIRDSGLVLNQLLNLAPQKRDADKLLEAAGLIAQAGQGLVGLEQQTNGLKINAAGVSSQNGKLAETFHNIDGGLAGVSSQLDRATALVNQVDINNLPSPNRASFADLKSKLNLGQLTLNNFKEVFSLSEVLALGDKRVLILFENNNELRAGGGFMGTFGSLKIHDGSISKINVSSIYDLDGQLTENIKPPSPLLNVNDRWYMRDSNWFADFPLTAQKVSGFFEKEGGETPDLVVALTPNIIIDWLKITGPLSLPNYGVTLTAENFVEQTQAAATLSDNLPTNSPKQILADLVPLLLQKLSGVDKSYYPQILQSLQDNLSSKQIVAYSRDANLQQAFENFHWSGSLAAGDRDYLSVVTSNLGGTKTDLYVEQKLELTTNIGPDGAITNELSVTRTNKMADLPSTANLSFIRVYVPQGSKLVSSLGFDYKSLSYPQGEKYKIDEDVYNWEKNSVTDNLTGTIIGQESDKTFFGNWLDIKGGESKTVKLVYTLPFKVADVDRLSLLLQKQIGAQSQNLIWNLNFPGRSIAWKNFDPNQLNTDQLNSDIILDKDYFLGVVLNKR